MRIGVSEDACVKVLCNGRTTQIVHQPGDTREGTDER
jgi:hypothetical protein